MEDEALRVELARLRDEDNRQNHRIDQLEDTIKVIQELTISVHTLAHDMQQMLEEQKGQGKRLDALEKEPADTWKKVRSTLITAVVSALATAIVAGAIFMAAQSL